MNSITIAGQLGKDSEQRHLPDGTAVLSFSIADNQGRDKPVVWWNCQLFGKRGDALAQYLIKGQSVTVSGSVTMREYTTNDGTPRKSMDVRVNDVALQGGRRESAAPTPQKPASKPAVTSGFDDMDDNIPF